MTQPYLATGSGLKDVKLRNVNGENIGEITEWIMDAERGRVLFVLARIGDSETEKCLPWPVLRADKEKGGYDVKEQYDLADAPEVGSADASRLVDDHEFPGEVYRSFGLELANHYSSSVYQEETERQPEDVEQEGYGGRREPEKYTTN